MAGAVHGLPAGRTCALWGAALSALLVLWPLGEARAQAPAGETWLWGQAAVWAMMAVALGVFLRALFRLGRVAGGFHAREQILVALFFGCAFLVISVQHLLLGLPLSFLLGPFGFIVEGLFYKLGLFMLLGILFRLVPRPGVYTLFYGLWMIAQAAFNGHTSPLVLVFGGISMGLIEGALWLGGITRSGGEGQWPGRPVRPGPVRLAPARLAPVLLAGLVIGLAEGLAIYAGQHVFQVVYRLHLEHWYMLAQAVVQGGYAAVGAVLGLRYGGRLAAILRQVSRQAPGQAPGQAPELAAGQAAGQARPDAPLLEAWGLSPVVSPALPPLLHDVSFRLEPGELVVLAGPSGGGKTTLLRTLKGLIDPGPGGEVRWRGSPLPGLNPEPWAARCALMFQEPALQIVRTAVQEEVAFGPELLADAPGVALAAPVEDLVRQALQRFGLEERAAMNLADLSGGELQRTALASLWVMGPEILLLDEPLAHQDSEYRRELTGMLAELAAGGMAVVVAEHRLEGLLDAASRVVWLAGGRIAWQGPPEDFRRSPWAAEALDFPGREGSPRKNSASHPDGPPLVSCKGLTWTPPGAGAALLKGAGFSVASGRRVALTGGNGQGKTSLLELLLGLEKPQGGQALLGGRDAARLGWRERARACGYLPQRADLLLQAATARDELLAGQAPGGGWSFEMADKWLERLGLQGRGDTFPHLLSKGERQRLALGALLAAGPGLLVLDEPFAGVDRRGRVRLLGLLEEFLEQDAGRSVLFTTHDPELLPWADEVWRLEAGLLVRGDVLPGSAQAEISRHQDSAAHPDTQTAGAAP
ncbi:MAG: ATP-binding cassette domain-containing protein [Deltaproteobacteria bacterium]|nr:ATP-binding cassette domain-containing protein [Deltaproteobacteria bacterium]